MSYVWGIFALKMTWMIIDATNSNSEMWKLVQGSFWFFLSVAWGRFPFCFACRCDFLTRTEIVCSQDANVTDFQPPVDCYTVEGLWLSSVSSCR